MAEDGRPVGMFSERDYARKIVLGGRSSLDTRIGSIMTTELVRISPGDSVDRGLALMTRSRIRHLPVVDDDRLVGLVSIGDLVKATIEQQQFVIERLEQYIST